jgi:hypothetical protein
MKGPTVVVSVAVQEVSKDPVLLLLFLFLYRRCERVCVVVFVVVDNWIWFKCCVHRLFGIAATCLCVVQTSQNFRNM